MDPKESSISSEPKLELFTMQKRIEESVNQIKYSNVIKIAKELMKEDLNRARALFCQAIMKSQVKRPQLSEVYASLVAVINAEFPDVGRLLAVKVLLQFKEAFDCNNEKKMQVFSKFLVHLINQRVVRALLAIEVMLLLLGKPNSDNVELAANFCIECGYRVHDVLPHKLKEIFREFKRVLRKKVVENRVQFLIVRLFAIRESRFAEYPSVIKELDLVEVDDQVTHHDVSLLIHCIDPETGVEDFEPDWKFNELED